MPAKRAVRAPLTFAQSIRPFALVIVLGHTVGAETPALALRATEVSDESFEAAAPGASAQGKEYQLTVWQGMPGVGSMAVGLDYHYTRYDYTNIDGRNRDLHRLQLPLRACWSSGVGQLQGTAAPGISTSSNVMKDLLDEFSGDDLLLAARLEASRSSHAGIGWLGGLAWDRSFGEPRLYPVAGVLFAPDEALEVRIAFPESWIRYRLPDRHEVLARVTPSGHEWHVVSEELDADFDYQVQGCRTEAAWSVRLWRGLLLDVSAAHETGRHHEFIDDLGVVVDADLDDALVLSVGLRLGGASIPRTHTVMP